MEELELISLKLTSGEELICKFVSKDNDTWVVKDARSIIMMPDGQLRLGPVLFSANKEYEIRISQRAIAVYSDYIRKEFLEAYTQSVSPLAIPKPGILMG